MKVMVLYSVIFFFFLFLQSYPYPYLENHKQLEKSGGLQILLWAIGGFEVKKIEILGYKLLIFHVFVRI